jgi:succinoglycan biosynthesis transport protein ExoP
MENQVPESSSAGFQIRDVVAILQMQWRVVAGCTIAALLLALVHGLLATRMYRSTAVLHLSTTAGQELKSDRVVDVDQYNRWNRQMFVQTQLEVMRSRSMMEAVLERYAELGYTDLPTDLAGVRALQTMLEVTPRQGTELLDLSITSENSEKSAILANLVAEVYREQNLEGLRDSAREAKEWLGEQITEYRTRIDESTQRMVEYQGANDLADVEEPTSSLSARMDSLNQALAELNTERVLLETTVWQHEKMLAEGKYEELAKALNTTLVSALTSHYADAVTNFAQISARYGPQVNEYKQSRAELDSIESELKAEVERSIAAERKQLTLVRSKEHNLKQEITGGKGQMLDSQGKEEQYGKLKVDLERAKEFYVRLNQRNDELDLQSRTQLNNVRIIDPARANSRPVEPNVPLNVAAAIMAGFIGGIGLGLVREYVDDTISSPLEVQTFLRVPFLGMIPKMTEETKGSTDLALYTHSNPRSNIAEALRAVRTVIELDPRGEPPRRLMVTSGASAEGKTTTIVWLGIAFANLGKKVLMIDGDLRRPRIHKIFGVDKDLGLASVLRGTPIQEAVRSTPVENLFFLPSGKGGERPNELLASAAMPALLDQLDELYDFVLIDSPPTVLLSDARILSRYVDGVVVLVREHTTSRMLVREAVTGLEQIGARVLGVIVNAVDLSQRRTSYKYHYGYGYGYGYGYRYDRYYDSPPEEEEERAAKEGSARADDGPKES